MSALLVLHCVDGLQTGGTELNAVRTALALSRRGVRVEFAVLRDGPLGEKLRAAGIPVHLFSVRGIRHWTALRCMRQFAQFCRQRGPDVVHCHDVYTNTLFGTAARMAGVPRIIVSRRWGINQYPRVLTLSSRLSYRFAHVVLANSEQVGESVHNDEGVSTQRILVIPNFVDDTLLDTNRDQLGVQMRQELGIASSAPVITMVARLVPEKDHATALAAVQLMHAELPELRLVLVGGGPLREVLQEQIRARQLVECVILAGEQSAGWRYYCAANLAMLTSTREGFPNSIVEAMAVARPIIATNVGGVGDAVHDGVTGFLAPAGDAAALATAGLVLLRDRDKAARFGLAALARAKAEYSETAVIGRLLERGYLQRVQQPFERPANTRHA